MGRLSKNDRKYAVSPRKARKLACPRCHCYPCGKVGACDPGAVRKQQRSDAYNQGKAEEQYEREHGGGGWGRMPATKKPAAKKTAKAKPAQSKAAFTRQFKKKNPTASDAEVKAAQKKAGYSVGCLSVIVFLALTFSGTGWGIYEGVRAVIG